MATDWEFFIEDLKQKTYLADHISQYVRLKKKGSNYFGLCPFHNEKTPSFSVDERRNIYHCFGCHVGGDVYKFYMDFNKLSFREAVSAVAERENVPLPESYSKEGTQRRDEEKRDEEDIETLTDAARFFHESLFKNDDAMSYLKKRDVTKEDIQKFALGYAGGSWSELKDHLLKKGHSIKSMARQSLAVYRRGYEDNPDNYFDNFRELIMFPLFDVNGRIKGFSGRVLDDGVPKYRNSSESSLFKKSNILYGLNFARDEIIRTQEAKLTEGYFDVISSHRIGIKNTVASAGTAVTEQQIRLLKRYARHILLLQDGDDAGIKAAKRAYSIIFPLQIETSLALLPPKKDVDNVCREYGREEIEEKIFKKMDIIEFHAKTQPAGQDRIFENLESLVQYFEQEKNPLRKFIWIRDVARKFDIPDSVLKERLKQTTEEKPLFLDLDAERIFDAYVANLLIIGSESRRHYFNSLPAKDVLFLPKNRQHIYLAMIKDYHSAEPQLSLALHAKVNGQPDIFENQKIREAISYLKQKLSEDKMEHFPARVFNYLAYGIPLSLEQSSGFLSTLSRESKKSELIKKLRDEKDDRNIRGILKKLDDLK